MQPNTESSYYARYRKTAFSFVWSGALLAAIGAISCASQRPAPAAGVLLTSLGVVALLFGGSCLLPHNLVKSFAQQCAGEPDEPLARGLLEGLTARKRIRLTRRSLELVRTAIAAYAAAGGADPELVRQLEQAVEAHLSRKIF
ncbi:MAG: hypothetical protein Q4C72_05095 [Eubacteriales bacterium]|nr:hypothetical protein [Eubacteriales bacterium]